MGAPRLATKQEEVELILYMKGIRGEGLTDAVEAVEELYIAVFDEYHTRGYGGKMMVIIDDNCITELFGWNDKGKLFSLYCSG